MVTSLLKASGLAIAAMTFTSGSMAAATYQVSTVTSTLALEAATAAEASCLKMGFHVAVTVVDAAGNVLATVREDSAAPHTITTSQRKAYTALSSRMPTTQLAKIVTANPEAFGMRAVDGFLILSGGLPIKLAETVIGAIGVSGSPGPDNDDKCAGAGIASITERLNK